MRDGITRTNRALMSAELNAAATFAALLVAGAFAIRALESLAELRAVVRRELTRARDRAIVAEDGENRARSQARHAMRLLEEQGRLVDDQAAAINRELADTSDACPTCGLDPCDCDEPEAGES